ncbi:MAG: hypothetical protein KYX68_06230 [Flavobacterium sp.]|nr:hypothetical protein [Flavobacterium sp.]
MKNEFELIHNYLEENESLYKGIQLYFSPLQKADILFIGINPGIGYFKSNNKNVKRFNPLDKFEYNGQKYYLAKQTNKLFKELNLGLTFSKSVKINHFPYDTATVNDLNKLLEKHKEQLKLYKTAKNFVLETILEVEPKLIICEGKSSFDRLKKYFEVESIEYNDDTYVFKTENFVAIGYKRNLSHIKNKSQLKEKIQKYYTSKS